MRRAVIMLLTSCFLGACAGQARDHVDRFSGLFTFGFETSAFVSDDGLGPWWLSSHGEVWPDVVAPIDAEGRGPWGQAHLVVEGVLSKPGRYGHLGAYSRELVVTRVIEAQRVPASGRP